jgi:regulatory protein
VSHTITRIEAQKKRKQRYSLFAGDTFVLGISLDTLNRHQISVGTVLDEKLLQTLKRSEESFQLREQAFRLLARRAHSRRELRDKLRLRSHDPDLIDQLIEDFSERKYLDDSRFACSFIEEELRMRLSGPALIRDKLRQKGIVPEKINQFLTELYPPELQAKNCRSLTLKKIKPWPVPVDRKRLTQLSGYLHNKGFSWDIIQPTIADIIGEDSYGET